MASCVLCRRVPRLRYIQGLRKEFTQAQHLCGKPEDETEEQEGKKGAFPRQKASLPGGYRLHHSPSSYHHSVWNSATSRRQRDNDEDERCLSTLAPSLWQQSNSDSVSCSQPPCSTKNTLLDSAFNKETESEMPSESPHHGKPLPPDVKVDTRAFHKCRPEYASITLDLTQRPDPIEWAEALPLLQKVAILKGSMKPYHVSQFLVELSRLHPDKMSLLWTNQRFTMLLRYSVEKLCLFTDLQLLEVLRSFVWLDVPTNHAVLRHYETELTCRANQMNLHQLLLAADLWRCIGRQAPRFLQHLYDSVPLYVGEMGVPELVQLLYIIGEGRHCPKDLIRPVKQLLVQHLQQLYPEEVGIVCLGLFKSQTSISESAVMCIVDKAHSYVREMSDFALVNVLKYLRFSYSYHRLWMEAMVEEVPRRAPRMAVQALMHVALACSAMHYRNEDILFAIAEHVPSLVPHCRSKDTCKMLWAFGVLRFRPVQNPNFYPSLIQSLRMRKAEFQRYPEHLLTGLLGLAFASQFPEDLIALALSPEFVELALKSKELELTKDLFMLDGTVALELPQWTGPRLSCELSEQVTEMLWKFAQSDVCQKPEVREAESALQVLLGGEQFVCKRMILPHTRSIDLEVHLDSTGKPIPVNSASHTTMLSPEKSASKFTSNQDRGRINRRESITNELLAQLRNTKRIREPITPSPTFKPVSLHHVELDEGRRFDTELSLTSGIIEALTQPSSSHSAPQDTRDTVKLAVQVHSRNHYFCHSQQLWGLHAMKRRQLKLAGYKVVELSYREWVSMLRKSRTEKLAYLHCKIYNHDDSLTSQS